MEPIIKVSHVTKHYRKAEHSALNAISFEVAHGAFFTLLGPNGAGKTTMISILTTTLLPTTGTAHIAGFDVATQPEEVRRRIGIIFQKPSLDPTLTAEENIRLQAVTYGLYPFRPTYALMPSAYKRSVSELAAVLGIEQGLGKPVHTLSGGERRKLEIVRSLLHRPQLLFLDEPTVGLDPASRRELWEYLRQARIEHGVTIFLTTHYLDEAEGADTICILNGGKIIAAGTPTEVKTALAGEEYLIIDATDREALRAELQRLGIPFDETPHIRIDLAGRSVQQVIQAITTPLTLVQTHMPSLEDAYLTIVGRE